MKVDVDRPGRLADKHRKEIDDSLDAQVLKDAQSFLQSGQTLELSYPLKNTQRTVGAGLSSAIVRKYGPQGPQGRLTLKLEGIAGQSFGAFATKGLVLDVTGEVNDYVGKGLSGGEIRVRPYQWREDQQVCGNTTLYGATSGRLFVAGAAGERFAVRNSGAEAVVEGLGAHGCEYMTGGRVVVLGRTGWNLAAGMSGGELFVLDPAGHAQQALNGDLAAIGTLTHEAAERLKELVEAHLAATRSPLAERLLADWSNSLRAFIRIIPQTVKAAEIKLAPEQARATA